MTRHHRRWQQGVLAGATVCTVFCSALGAGQDLANLDLEDLLKTDITITQLKLAWVPWIVDELGNGQPAY